MNSPSAKHHVLTSAYIITYYSTDVQIVSCTLSSDSVLSESIGLSNPVLYVISFDIKKPIRLCALTDERLQGHYSPSALGDFNRVFEG